MSTRKRNAFSDPSTPPKSYLPPPRKGKAIAHHKTTPPLSHVRFSSFVYILSGLAFAFIAFNAWRMLQLKTAAGGWWNLALGRRPQDSQPHSYGAASYGGGGDRERESVEDRINALAEALGIPSHELASAIADAVKSHIPPASLSAISAAAEATQSGTASKVLAGENHDGEVQQRGMMMGETLSAFAGFDDPDME